MDKSKQPSTFIQGLREQREKDRLEVSLSNAKHLTSMIERRGDLELIGHQKSVEGTPYKMLIIKDKDKFPRSERLRFPSELNKVFFDYILNQLPAIIKDHPMDERHGDCQRVANVLSYKVSQEIEKQVRRGTNASKMPVIDTGVIYYSKERVNIPFFNKISPSGFDNHYINIVRLTHPDNPDEGIVFAFDMSAHYNIDRYQGTYDILGFMGPDVQSVKEKLAEYYGVYPWKTEMQDFS